MLHSEGWVGVGLSRWKGGKASQAARPACERLRGGRAHMLCGEGEEVHEGTWQEMRGNGG